MRRTSWAGTLLAVVGGLSGCHLAHRADAPCPPPASVTDDGQAQCQPKVDVQGGNTVIQLPQSKIAIETPAPLATAQGVAGGTPQAVPFAYPQAMAAGFPQAAFGGMPGAAFGAPGGIVSGEVRQRTGLGFAFEPIKISIPWIRLIPIQRPTEVTFQTQSAFGAGAGFAAGVPYGVPMGVPLGVPAGVPYGVPTGVPVAAGAGFAVPQGGPQLTPQQLALVQAALAAQGAGAQGAGSTTDQQLEELLQKCEELKKLKLLKQQMQSQSQPMPPPPPPSPPPGGN